MKIYTIRKEHEEYFELQNYNDIDEWIEIKKTADHLEYCQEGDMVYKSDDGLWLIVDTLLLKVAENSLIELLENVKYSKETLPKEKKKKYDEIQAEIDNFQRRPLLLNEHDSLTFLVTRKMFQEASIE